MTENGTSAGVAYNNLRQITQHLVFTFLPIKLQCTVMQCINRCIILIIGRYKFTYLYESPTPLTVFFHFFNFFRHIVLIPFVLILLLCMIDKYYCFSIVLLFSSQIVGPIPSCDVDHTCDRMILAVFPLTNSIRNEDDENDDDQTRRFCDRNCAGKAHRRVPSTFNMLRLSNFSKRQWLTLIVFSIADFCNAICVSLQAPFYPYEVREHNFFN